MFTQKDIHVVDWFLCNVSENVYYDSSENLEYLSHSNDSLAGWELIRLTKPTISITLSRKQMVTIY
jgi:hypothetical protein